MSGAVHVFGVRHLSPGGAWHLRALLDRVKPKVICVEGLADAGPMVHHLQKKGTKPPVAILAYTDSVPVRTLVYPLAAYSPEFQAVVWAKENGAAVEFIDLPSDVFLGLQDVEIERLTRANEKEQEAQPDGTAGEAEKDAAWRPERGESIYERIAAREGEPDYDAYWERRFEHNLNDAAYQKAAFELGRALRDEQDEPVWRAENLVREAYMRRRIREVLADGVKPEQVVAVVGAFHAPVLGPELPAMTDAELASLRRRPGKLTLMPYSYFKLSSQSGYGAGNRAPAYFHLCWEMIQAGGLAELPHRYLAEVVRHQRAAGTYRSTAEVIEGVRLARTLAAMHDGSAPTLADLHDAAVTLIGHGDPATIAEALAEVDVGTAIGALPQGVARTSIQEDFDRQAKRLLTPKQLKEFQEAKPLELELELRRKKDPKGEEAALRELRLSSFLHRLRVLEISAAKQLERKSDQITAKEKWRLHWKPESEIELVEAVLLGETVELAAGYKFKQRLDAAVNIGEAADVVMDSCLCGLGRSTDAARKRLQELAAVSSDLAAVAHAAARLSQVVRYGDVRKFDPAPLLPLIDELFVQGALALFGAANCDNQAAATYVEAIDQLNRVSDEHHDRVEVELWLRELRKLSDADDRNPLLSGYACAVLLERNEVATDHLAREVSRRLSPGIPADLGAGWFEGLSKRNRGALLARQPLWAELAGYVAALNDDQFRRAIVFLRRAFGGFTPHQKRQICENLAEHWGVNADAASEALTGELTEKEQKKLGELSEFNFDDI